MRYNAIAQININEIHYVYEYTEFIIWVPDTFGANEGLFFFRVCFDA